ncbi:MAG: hypothetical protein NC388_01320 [Clostridium sp.]|nr:hypothetical protein [Clostridium sp.]
MYQIQSNASGTRQMWIDEKHLETIRKYALFADLIDSNGIITETVLDKLKLNVQSLMQATPDNADLITLCRDVLFHDNMKAFGLHQLITLYLNRLKELEETAETTGVENA